MPEWKEYNWIKKRRNWLSLKKIYKFINKKVYIFTTCVNLASFAYNQKVEISKGRSLLRIIFLLKEA